MRRPSRAALRRIGVALLAATAVLVAALRLEGPALRRWVVTRVNAALASALAGRVTVDRVDDLGLEGAAGVFFTAADPDGRTVLTVENARARVSAWAAATSFLRGKDIVVDLSDASIARADIDLDTGDDGAIRIARAFAPRSPSTGPPGRGVRIVLANALIDHLRVHGTPPAGPSIDASVSDVRGSVRFAPGSLEVVVSRATMSPSAVPGLEAKAAGTLAGHSPCGRRVPSRSPRRCARRRTGRSPAWRSRVRRCSGRAR